jgi:hypothetical protein
VKKTIIFTAVFSAALLFAAENGAKKAPADVRLRGFRM